MKYFTPELYMRGQSHDDDVLNEVEQQWEAAGERYVCHLEQIRPDLTPSLRYLLDSFYVHDAGVRALGRQGDTCVIVLQLDTPPHELLILTYRLVSEPAINKEAFPAAYCSVDTHVEWMYDEVSLEPEEPPVYGHAILLSNGWEIQLRFRELEVAQVQAWLPLPRTGLMAPTVADVPQSA